MTPGLMVELAVGDRVVYGSHGIGCVATLTTHDVRGEPQQVVVLELEKLTVTLPVVLAEKLLRPLATEWDLQDVGETLRHERTLSPRNWLSRRGETLEKLTGGTPVELAQIVREGAQRERQRSAARTTRHISSTEQEIFTRARTLLTEEVAVTLDMQPAEAERWIEAHLDHSVAPPSL